MEKTIRLALAQINLTVGDLKGNTNKILEYVKRAKANQADIVVFPELTICGYPPEDLLLKPKFIDDNLKALRHIEKHVDDIVVIAGFADRKWNRLYNAAAVIAKKKTRAVYHKMCLPNYSVFDEHRYFVKGAVPLTIAVDGVLMGINICEDIWEESGPLAVQAKMGAKIILNMNASPYYKGKVRHREEVVKKHAKENNVYICYANLVGGQDELVFDGHSMVCDKKGRIIARASEFKEEMLLQDIKVNTSAKTKNIVKIDKTIEKKQIKISKNKPIIYHDMLDSVYQALVLGLRDYTRKNGFEKVILGLSGGIDSALAVLIAVDALGKDNVCVLSMPSGFSAQESKNDAKKIAGNLEIQFKEISIDKIFKHYIETLPDILKKQGIAKENIQARIRGNIVMAYSNNFGWLVITTGNKSETSVGYCTLYGDMAGGFAVIKDVPKTMVYELARKRCGAEDRELIPEGVFTRPPSAELADDQKDSDSLPEYDVLDPILASYVEEHKSGGQIIKQGYSKHAVEKVLRLIDRNEYKRRQAPVGIKITPIAFGKDRRMPIINHFKS